MIHNPVSNFKDLTDVSVPTPTDGYFVYWDNATSLWKCKAHADLTTGVHGVGTNYLAYTKGSQKEALFHNTYMCRAYLNVDQLDLTDNTTITVLLDAVSFDPSSAFDLTNHYYVVPVTGYYYLNGQVTFVSDSIIADKFYSARIYNGDVALCHAYSHSSHVYWLNISTSTLVHLTAGNHIMLKTRVRVGANTVDVASDTTRTYLYVFLLQTD